ncbi:TIGR03032 family protein [Parvularcula marina]|uniref:TIGR03032 family protein n=1 Tax=Parvularcula marina TaxID=2292771 RepID=A0A371RGI3_9PROT|nr:TIGR03032 family protein [Parvularcula marina]RFB04551.1 TIGR03032 family protein [Parvularcula marina]
MSEAPPQLELTPSRMFPSWLANSGSSLAFTTYQAGKVFFIGTNREEGKLSIFERTFNRCMGLGVHERRLWLSSLYQLFRFENFLDEGQQQGDYDAVYVPVEARTTGDVDIHDVHPYRDGRQPIFVVTRFNCIATFDERNSFAPVWIPPFIDRLAAEDRCHLNGLAMKDGEPAYVTCVSRTNVSGGWREHRMGGGVIVSVPDGKIVAEGLSMPHSPRLYDGQLYVLQSGIGEFGRINLETGAFEKLCFLPGFARGLTFLGRHAIIGVSRPRAEKTFEGLALDDRLKEQGISSRCQLAVVNLDTGDIEHTLEIDGVVQELYDVGALPGIVRPQAIGFKTDDIRFVIRPAKTLPS